MKITELMERLHNITIEEFSQLKQELASDARKGVHTLFRQTERRFALEQQQRIDFKEQFTFEEQYHQQGYRRIAGVDEVGRGPLAGPVVAAAVILPEGFYHPGLTDSKQMSKIQRQAAFKNLQDVAEIAVGTIEPAEIDEINIYQASKRAMQVAVRQL
jgi:ribonuclease HII